MYRSNYEEEYKVLSNEDFFKYNLTDERSVLSGTGSLKSGGSHSYLTKDLCEKTSTMSKGKKNRDEFSAEKRVGKWTEDEDEVLKNLVYTFGGKNWKKIAEYIKGRTPIQCLHRWTKILQPGLVKGPWSIIEDKKLLEWVSREGPSKWTQCAEFIKGRNGKQCRERWFNSLNPCLKKGNWTAEEDFKLFFYYKKCAGKWSTIAVYFEGRTENALKNRFFSTLRRIYTEKKKDLVESNQHSQADCEHESVSRPSDFSASHVGLDELKQFIPEAEQSVKFIMMTENKISEHEIALYEKSLLDVIGKVVKPAKSMKVEKAFLLPKIAAVNSMAEKFDKSDKTQILTNSPATTNNCNQTQTDVTKNGNTFNFNVNFSSNNNGNFILNSPIPNNMSYENMSNSFQNPMPNYNMYKSMDIYNLEKDIADMCDTSLFFPDTSLDNQLDNFIENMFGSNNILLTTDPMQECNICQDTPSSILPTNNTYSKSNFNMNMNNMFDLGGNTSNDGNSCNNGNIGSSFNNNQIYEDMFKSPHVNVNKSTTNLTNNVSSNSATTSKDGVWKLKCDNGKNKNEVYQSLLSQLNGLEKLVKNAKKELSKFDSQEGSEDLLNANYNIDNLFKF